MLKINLSFEKPRLNINGEVFDVLRSDAQIVQDMLDLDATFQDRDMTNPANVLEKNREMLEYIDKLLGSGAVDKISKSVPELGNMGLGLGGITGILAAISEAAGQAYSASFDVKYSDD